MTSLWAALNDAARTETTLHLPFARACVPWQHVLAAAEQTAVQVDRSVSAQRDQPRLGLLMANGEPWLRGLAAAWRAGAVAVPLALPVSASGLDGYATQTARLVATAELDAVLVDRSVARLAARLKAQLDSDLPMIDITEAPTGLPTAGLPPVQPDAELLALIQYTSGSTSAPKGVALTHGNVLAGLRTIIETIEYAEHDRLGLWLPLFHDMGLFSALTCFLSGASTWLWRPTDFVRSPISWLTGFAQARATSCPAPNFAFDLLVDAAREGLPADLDLSAWRLALNGAESVKRSTVDSFAQTFQPYGLPVDMMSGCYGLAEATLMVTFSALRRPLRTVTLDRFSASDGSRVLPVPVGTDQARDVVSVGPPAPGIQLRIGTGSPDGVVGEIQIRGASVTRGYVGLADDQQPITGDGWLRTGDLGFRHAGELFVVGRSKDMIVVRGQNYHAEDVEQLVLQAAGDAAQRCAAIQIDGEEIMTVVMETTVADPAAAAELARRLEREAGQQLGGAALRVLPVAPRSIPMTTSGKVKRHALKNEIREGVRDEQR